MGTCAPVAAVNAGLRPPATRVALTGAWYGARELRVQLVPYD